MINDFLFKLLHRRLPVGENRTYQDDVACICDDDLETHQHLFAECSLISQYWRWFQQAVRRSLRLNIDVSNATILFSSVPPSRIKKHQKAMWRILEIAHPEALYAIWLTRCNAIFRCETFDSQTIASCLRSRLRLAFSACQHLNNITNFTQLSAALIAELDGPV
jgi:hypothetical protein